MKPFPKRRLNISNMDMPWVGICVLERGQGYALIAETPDDASVGVMTIERDGRSIAAPRLMGGPSMRTFRYARRALYRFAASGGYVALAPVASLASYGMQQ